MSRTPRTPPSLRERLTLHADVTLCALASFVAAPFGHGCWQCSPSCAGYFPFANRSAFPELLPIDALRVSLQGLRFDAMTMGACQRLCSSCCTLVPFPWRDRPGYQRALFALFLMVNALVLLLCCIDAVLWVQWQAHHAGCDRIAGTGWARAAGLPGPLLVGPLTFIAGIAALAVGWKRLPVPDAEERRTW